MEAGDADVIVTTEIKADVIRANLFNPVIIAEDDENSHVLTAQITADDADVSIPSEFTVGLEYLRADGHRAFVSGTVENGKISVILPDDMFILDDIVECNMLCVYSKSITTHSLSIVNGKIAVTPIQSQTDCPLRSGKFYIDSQLRVIV